MGKSTAEDSFELISNNLWWEWGEYMPYSKIIVQRRGGGYIKGAKVSLGFSFSHHPLSAGVTKSYYTNEYGEATIEHSNTGRATIYVNGKDVGDFNAPDREVVFI